MGFGIKNRDYVNGRKHWPEINPIGFLNQTVVEAKGYGNDVRADENHYTVRIRSIIQIVSGVTERSDLVIDWIYPPAIPTPS